MLIWALMLFAAMGCSHSPPVETNDESVLPQALREKGLKLYSQGDYAKAIPPLEAAATMVPAESEVPHRWKYLLYYCYLSTGDYQKAKEQAESLLQVSPYQALSYQQVGLAELWLGDAQRALKNFQRAIEFNAQNPKLHFYMGIAHEQLNRPKQRDEAFHIAEENYQKILSKNPKDFAANFDLASLYVFSNRELEKIPFLVQSAKETIALETEQAEQGELADPSLYRRFYLPLLEGMMHYRTGDPQTAVTRLLEALGNAPGGAKPDLAEVYFYLGKSHLLLGNQETGKLFLTQSLDLDPKGPYSAAARAVK